MSRAVISRFVGLLSVLVVVAFAVAFAAGAPTVRAAGLPAGTDAPGFVKDCLKEDPEDRGECFSKQGSDNGDSNRSTSNAPNKVDNCLDEKSGEKVGDCFKDKYGD